MTSRPALLKVLLKPCKHPTDFFRLAEVRDALYAAIPWMNVNT